MEGEAVGSCPPPGISTSCPPHAGSWQGCTGGSELLWRWELSTTPKTPCVLEARVPAPPNSTYSERCAQTAPSQKKKTAEEILHNSGHYDGQRKNNCFYVKTEFCQIPE